MILSGWKDIANYLHHGVRTVQRWESLGLPVRRPHGRLRSAVIATTEELDQWVLRAPARDVNELTWLRNRVSELEAELAAVRSQSLVQAQRVEIRLMKSA